MPSVGKIKCQDLAGLFCLAHSSAFADVVALSAAKRSWSVMVTLLAVAYRRSPKRRSFEKLINPG